MTHAKPSPLIIIALFIIAIHGLALLVLPWLLERVDSSMVGFGMVCYLLLVIMVYIYHSAGVKRERCQCVFGRFDGWCVIYVQLLDSVRFDRRSLQF